MAANKKYDYVQICAERGLKYLYEENPNIFIEDGLGFKHKITRTNFARGSDLGFKSVIGSKTDYFKRVFYEKFRGRDSEKLSFEGFEYKKSLQYTFVVCLVHGKYRTKPNWLLSRGHHCEDCSEENRSERRRHSLEDFIALSKQKHGDRYEYSLVDYDGCRKPVNIVCREHGEFSQVPYYHLAGNGCPECGKLSGGYSATDYARVCPDGSSIYLMRLSNASEMFYKIGISKDANKRSKDISRQSGYVVNVLSIMTLESAEKVFYCEKYLHDIFKYFSYTPQVTFQGFTECFSYISVEEFDDLKETLYRKA